LAALAVLLPTAAVMAQSDDANAMAQRIGSRLKESGQLHDYRIGIEYADGVARLSGTVVNWEQAEAAGRLTQQVAGVSRVVNELTLAEGGAPSPAAAQPTEPNKLASHQPAPISRMRGNRDAPPAQGNWIQPARPMPNNVAQRNVRQPVQQAAAGPRPMARPMAQPMAQRQPQPRRPQPMPMNARMAAAGRGAHPAVYQGAPRGAQPMPAQYMAAGGGQMPMPAGYVPGGNVQAASYDSAQMPGYAWPSYASYPNYAALTYPRQYSPTAWPYIGPFYPYPQVPLGWRKVSLEWDDGWWFLDFSDRHSAH
jgi:hypothetical protein